MRVVSAGGRGDDIACDEMLLLLSDDIACDVISLLLLLLLSSSCVSITDGMRVCAGCVLLSVCVPLFVLSCNVGVGMSVVVVVDDVRLERCVCLCLRGCECVDVVVS